MAPNRQEEFRFRSWGGPRKHAGRKPTGTRIGAMHRARPDHKPRFPVLANWTLLPHVWNLRAGRCFRVLRRAFGAGCDRGDAFRLVHFSVQGNHIHLLVEAQDKHALANGLRALGIRAARALNAVMGRRGRVLARYHARALETPREARDALVYVFHNQKKHALQYGKPLPRGYVDPCTSAAWFDGWKEGVVLRRAEGTAPVAAPRTWLMTAGWRRHGLISVDDMPRAGGARVARPRV
jgi:REP element-mobilizing transposase RayT